MNNIDDQNKLSLVWAYFVACWICFCFASSNFRKLKAQVCWKKMELAIHNKRENKHQQSHLDWQKPSAKTDVLLPLFSRNYNHRNSYHFYSILLNWSSAKYCSILSNSN